MIAYEREETTTQLSLPFSRRSTKKGKKKPVGEIFRKNCNRFQSDGIQGVFLFSF